MKVVFMGTPDFAVASLAALLESQHEVVGVVTAPDRKAGRGKKYKSSPVKTYAQTRGLHIMQPDKLRNPEFLKELTALHAELFVVVAFRMLPEVVWSMPPKGSINLHASLLPDYRGAAPINRVLMNGETQTGLTTFFIEKDIDTGGIIDKVSIDIPDDCDAGILHDCLMDIGARLLVETVDKIADGTAIAKAQNVVTQCREAPKLDKVCCCIDWHQDTQTVYNQIRGLSPYPGAWTTWNGKKLKILKAAVGPGTKKDETAVLFVDKDRVWVNTINGLLELIEVQPESKKRMSAAEFIRGYQPSGHFG